MNRGILTTLLAMLAAQAQAHVSHAEGMAHANEHLLLLALIPLALLGRPLVRRLLRIRKH